MSEAPAFKPGDVVHLKSGGQTMTVSEIRWESETDVTKIRCMWHTTDGYVQLADFPPEALVVYRAEDDAKIIRESIVESALAGSHAIQEDWRKSRGL